MGNVEWNKVASTDDRKEVPLPGDRDLRESFREASGGRLGTLQGCPLVGFQCSFRPVPLDGDPGADLRPAGQLTISQLIWECLGIGQEVDLH